jgi:hypothetical protein
MATEEEADSSGVDGGGGDWRSTEWWAPLSKASKTASSYDDSLEVAASDDAETQGEDALVMDPRKAAQSYDFGASSVTVGRIRQLETLGYFVEGSACEPGEETVLELADDEVVVFEEFSSRGFECHLSWLSPRSCLNIGCNCIS